VNLVHAGAKLVLESSCIYTRIARERCVYSVDTLAMYAAQHNAYLFGDRLRASLPSAFITMVWLAPLPSAVTSTLVHSTLLAPPCPYDSRRSLLERSTANPRCSLLSDRERDNHQWGKKMIMIDCQITTRITTGMIFVMVDMAQLRTRTFQAIEGES